MKIKSHINFKRFIIILLAIILSYLIFNAYGIYNYSKEYSEEKCDVAIVLGAIGVSMLDVDPVLAANIVKDVVGKSDSIYRNMLQENKTTVMALLDKQIEAKKSIANGNDMDELKKLMAIRDQYAVSSSSAFKTLYVVEEPVPAVKKYKPVRWLIVLATAVASFFLASFSALVIELYKHADKYGFQRS